MEGMSTGNDVCFSFWREAEHFAEVVCLLSEKYVYLWSIIHLYKKKL